ncbi:MAG: hypothetical protein LUQ09_05490 [Methanomassiliicoccales archaeon]|nr:hypothetical protein [Methanomassiliicoccales archaeon]
MDKKTLETVKNDFVGVEYSLCIANEITTKGLGFSVSCETGTITDVFLPSIED